MDAKKSLSEVVFVTFVPFVTVFALAFSERSIFRASVACT